MTTRQSLNAVLDKLPEERLVTVLEFAEFIAHRDTDEIWADAARQRFAQAYADDEPEYSEADLKPKRLP
ncbi:MAG TPA: hypothetical protein VF669_18140 [Tepidisphaeraceae bacterium]|jgi:hypothetical protein